MKLMNKYLIASALLLVIVMANLTSTSELQAESEFSKTRSVQKRSLSGFGATNVNRKKCTKGWCSVYSRTKCCPGYYCKRSCSAGGCSDHGSCILRS